MRIKKIDRSIELKDNAMLKRRPELFYEWDFEKNDELGLDVYQITFGSDKKAWWTCPDCESSYDMEVSARAGKSNYKCPYCSRRRVNHTNSLFALNPVLAKEWHPTKNGDLTPHDVTSNYSKKVWWSCSKCKSSHDATVNGRAYGNDCRYCAGRDVNHTNSLATLMPNLATEWNLALNGSLTPHDITCGSRKKVWWDCPDCESSYDMPVVDRKNGIGCSYCGGRRVNHTNSLASLCPDIAREWHSTKNGGLTPSVVACGSDIVAWWLGDCGHEWDAKIEERARKHSGCPYCSGHRLLVGFNDMWTTNPELAKMLLNHEDGYRYMQGSNVSVDWKCLVCDNIIRNKSINNTFNRGFSCPRCSDGVSFPEKFVYNLLKGADIDFLHEKSFGWSQGKRYDFYLPKNNWIIEVHGGQHYREGFRGIKGARSLKEEKESDRTKYNLAKENEIENYIVIDCRESTIEWIKNSILNSSLMDIVEGVDFERIGQLASSSLIKDTCDLWNSGNKSLNSISTIMKLSYVTILRYLKRGTEIGWCDYTVEKNNKNGGKSRRKAIIQLSLEGEFIKEWNSITEAAKYYNTTASNISSCLREITSTACGFKWIYAENHKIKMAD